MLLHELLEGHRLILASASPRRRQLLSECGLQFVIAEPFECEESYPDTLPRREVAEYLSRLKSEAYPHPLAPNEILITADTTVLIDNTILGKPRTEEEAVRMIAMLSGRSHIVTTGVTLRTAECTHSFAAESTVRFRTITDEEARYYVEHYRPLDKAGAYGIQEWIGYVAIEGIEGSFYNVMGLPVQRLYKELESFIK